MDEKLFLKPNVLIEPLVNQWYAWPYLIPPVTAAMVVANSHLKIMRSYIKAPQIHAAAVKNPDMLGGPFIDYDGKRVDEIKALIESTIKEQAPLLELAEGIKTLEEQMRNEAKGYSLEPLYQKIPPALRGYVELVYDLNNHPAIRFFENLLYRSPYYDTSQQSFSLSLMEEDYRSFIFSTPRLPDERKLQLHLPFRAEAMDQLFRMKHEPQSLGAIKDALGLNGESDSLWQTFLTARAPQNRASRYDGEGVRIRYYGHACLLIETRELSVLVDPFISYEYASDIPRYTLSDLPDDIDYVLITHSHQDHAMLETLLHLRYKIKHLVVPRNSGGFLADPSLKLILQQLGFKQIIELDELETLEIGEDSSVTGIPFLGEHCDVSVRSKIAHLVKMNGRLILCAADSSNIEPELYDHVNQAVGDIDTLFLGMECYGGPLSWVYGPLITKSIDRKMDESRRLSGSDFVRGIDLVDRVGCSHAYVYAMGQEPWLTHIMSLKYDEDSLQITESNKLVETCRNRGMVSERLYGQKEIFL